MLPTRRPGAPATSSRASTHKGPITRTFLEVLEALLWGFHNSRSGVCFPSYEAITAKADCHRSTVAEALKALEWAGVLSWQNRITRAVVRQRDLFWSPAQAATMVGQSEASRCGSRAWYAQAGSLRSTGPINHVRCSDGLLLVQTSEGMLSAIDAETGRKLWSTRVGRRHRVWRSHGHPRWLWSTARTCSFSTIDSRASSLPKGLGNAPGAGPQ